MTQMASEVVRMVNMAEAERIGEDGGLGPDLDVHSWVRGGS